MGAMNPPDTINWEAVFDVRCKAKLGQALTEADQRLITKARAADPDRYRALGDRVFAATAPFGSTRRGGT